MKAIGLVVNPERDRHFAFAQKVAQALTQNGFVVYGQESGLQTAQVHALKDELFFETVDVILTLGGDGTILQVADKAALYNKPILGLNLGHLGYLTQLRPDDLNRLPGILSGSLKTELRFMLSVHVLQKNKTEKEYIVLNDAVISRKLPGKMIRLNLYAEDEFVYSYRSDGLIFATPTGSTAYSLSAGGPIADSDLQDIIIVNPVCEHSMFSKPLIFSAHNRLSCRTAETNADAVLSLDGKNEIPLDDIEQITVTKSAYKLPLVQPDGNRFYQILNQKFSERGVK